MRSNSKYLFVSDLIMKYKRLLIYQSLRIIWILASLVSVSPYVSAQNKMYDSIVGNCDLISTFSEKWFANISDTWEKEVGNILPKEAIIVAENHLKSFCCKEWYLRDAKVCSKLDEVYPESSFLFDHILDVYLRRLDAFWGDKNSKGLMYGLSPDPQGKERRDFMVKALKNPLGSSPDSINAQYWKYWKMTTDPIHNIDQRDNVECRIIQQNNKKQIKIGMCRDDVLVSINKDFHNWKLVNKYNNACKITELLYRKLGWRFTTQDNLGKKYSLDAMYANCKKLVKKRIQEEYEYAKIVLLVQWNKFMENYLHGYLINNVVQNNMKKLQEKIRDITVFFDDVNKAVVKIISKCS